MLPLALSEATPAELRIAVDRERGRRRFADFVKIAWRVVEPNPLTFGWHMGAICEHAEAVSNGEIRDLCVCVPPGTGKSLLLSTFWPAWDWIRKNTRRWITATYGQDLSEKNARLHRDLIKSDWYQERWGDLVRLGKESVDKVRHFKLESGGWRWSTSVGGVVTGYHADILLADDLVKAQDATGRAAIDMTAIEQANDFWFNAMQTRRADPRTTARVMIAQRLHHEDAPARALAAGYTPLVLPMEYDPRRSCVTVLGFKDPRKEEGELLFPERFPREVVEDDKIKLGPQAHEAQNQQNPTPTQGLLFKTAGERRWAAHAPPKVAALIITVDAAFKASDSSDFVSIQVWGVSESGTEFYLFDNHTERLTFGQTCDAVLAMRGNWPQVSGIYIEDKANGPAIIDTLSAKVAGVVAWEPTGSKLARAQTVAPLFDAGNVYLPPDDRAPWVANYLTELRRFPLTKHDDQVDATTMALLILHQPQHTMWALAVAKMRAGG